jgi:hypothetical protein
MKHWHHRQLRAVDPYPLQYTAQSEKSFAVWVSLLIAFLLAFIFVVIIVGTSRSITASLHSPINSFAPALVADLLVATATTSFDSELQHVDWSPIAQRIHHAGHVKRPSPVSLLTIPREKSNIKLKEN